VLWPRAAAVPDRPAPRGEGKPKRAADHRLAVTLAAANLEVQPHWERALTADCPNPSPPVDGIYCTWEGGTETFSGLGYDADLAPMVILSVSRPATSPLSRDTYEPMRRFIARAMEPEAAVLVHEFALQAVADLSSDAMMVVDAPCGQQLTCHARLQDRGPLGLAFEVSVTSPQAQS
jgi:hypothetical protein